MAEPSPCRVVVLVRGINVGRAKQVAMSDLAAALADIGGTGVRTYLRSGNAVMDVELPGGRGRAAATRAGEALGALGAAAEEALLARSGVSARVLVVSADRLRAVAAANPFPELVEVPKQLHVLFCETQPDPAELAALGLRHGADEIVVGDHVLYVGYRGGPGATGSPLEKVLPKVKVTTTSRNWTTVCALLALCDG